MGRLVNLESLYLRLPITCQNWAIGFEGRRVQRRRYGRGYAEFAAAVLQRESYSPAELARYRADRLAKHLEAAAQTPFWRERFARFEVDPCASDPFSALSRLPLLTKEEVKANAGALCLPTGNPSERLSVHTSGTTGSGLVFVQTRAMERVTWATWWRYRGWHGLKQSDWCAYFGGRSVVPISQRHPPYWRWNHPGRQLLFSGYHLSSRTAQEYARALCEANIGWMHGYPSLLALLATFVTEQGLALPRVQIITVGAENLLPTQKSMISTAFQAPVVQHYGQAEGVANISQCPEGRMHVDEDYAGVEFLPLEDMPGSFRIVGTNWNNPVFPLLRYDTGDIATIDRNDSCSCGRLGRVIRAIDGRQEDYVVLPSGVKIGRMDHVFKDMVNIREAQIVQHHSGEIVVRVVRGSRYRVDDERMLLEELHKRLGCDITISIQYPESIARTRSGKLRLVVKE
jgi:phenylacetate-CoA ligase